MQLLVGYSNSAKKIFTQEVKKNGKLVPGNLLNEEWEDKYSKFTSFSIGYTHYVAFQSTDNKFFIYEITQDGKLGTQTCKEEWGNYYHNLFSFKLGDNVYIAGQAESNNFFIQAVKSDGTLGEETDSCEWGNYYPNLSSFVLDGKVYITGQNEGNNKFFIEKIESNGKLGGETYSANWHNFYPNLFSFEINNKPYGRKVYVAGQTENFNKFFVQEIKSGGKLGNDEVYAEKWGNFYGTMFAYQADGKTYIGGHSEDSEKFFIQMVLPDGKLGPEIFSENSFHFKSTLITVNF